MRIHAQSLQTHRHVIIESTPNHCKICVVQKIEFLTNRRDLKNIEGRQYVFVCENLTSLWYKQRRGDRPPKT